MTNASEPFAAAAIHSRGERIIAAWRAKRFIPSIVNLHPGGEEGQPKNGTPNGGSIYSINNRRRCVKDYRAALKGSSQVV